MWIVLLLKACYDLHIDAITQAVCGGLYLQCFGCHWCTSALCAEMIDLLQHSLQLVVVQGREQFPAAWIQSFGIAVHKIGMYVHSLLVKGNASAPIIPQARIADWQRLIGTHNGVGAL